MDGTAELVIGGAEADVFVLIEPDGSGRLLSAAEVEVTPVAAIDPTRSTARVEFDPARPGEGVDEALGEGACAGLGRALVSVSSELVGVCDRALGMTVEYVKDRRQFGVPVGSFQAVSHRCAQMLLDTEQARATAASAAWTADAGEGGTSSLAEAAAMAKAAASEAGREVTAAAIQAITVALASPGRPTCTGCTSAPSSTRRYWAARGATALAWLRSWPRALRRRLTGA